MSSGVRTARRLLGSATGALSAAWLLGVVAAVTFPGLVSGADPLRQDLRAALQGPSRAHPLGTDVLGRDLLSRLVHGGADALWGLVAALVVAVVIGVSLGLLAGFVGGIVDVVISRSGDIVFALPNIVILLVVVAIHPGSTTVMMATFGALASPGLMRIVRGATLATKEEPFVAAARIAGLSSAQILRRHLLPRLSGLILVQASLIAALALVLQSGLGFLGFGLPAPQPSWGGMIAGAVATIGRHPWELVPPGVAIGVTALALALLGDAIRDASVSTWSTSKLARRPSRRSRLEQRSLPVGDAAPAPTSDGGAILDVRGLTVQIPINGKPTTVVDDVSVQAGRGEVVGIVGESGSGKSVAMLSVLGLVPGGGRVVAGHCTFDGRDVFALPREELERLRGSAIAYVSQEPGQSLDPTFRVGSQLIEAVRRHTGLSRKAARARAIELLASTQLPDPEQVMRRYPHQVSGGMAQRIAIALALAGDPALLIADEPTTALDVTIQADILDLLRRLSDEREMAVVLVTHDWGVVADLCDRAVVMYAGQVVESGATGDLISQPRHPYTHALLGSNPAWAEIGTRRLPTIGGLVPTPGQWPDGCRFAPRCPFATSACTARPVDLDEPHGPRPVRCISPEVFTLTKVDA